MDKNNKPIEKLIDEAEEQGIHFALNAVLDLLTQDKKSSELRVGDEKFQRIKKLIAELKENK